MNIKLRKDNERKVQELKAHIDHHFNRAVQHRAEKTTRFQKSWLYYLCKAPAKKEGENSSYIEPVIRRAVETLRPSILNIFTENEKKAVTFRPTLKAPPGVAEGIDMMVNHIFLQENDGYSIIERAITETLVCGDTFLRVFLEDDVVEEDEVELMNTSYEEVAPLLAQYPHTDISEVQTDTKTGLMTGTIIPRRVDTKRVVEHVNFADIFVDACKEDIADVPYVGVRSMMTVGELLDFGYDKDKVITAGIRGMDYDTLNTDTLINDGTFSGIQEDFSYDEMAKEVAIYEHYIRSSIFNKRGKYKTKLLQVVATSQDILAINEVEFLPFIHGVAERIPGSFWGVSLYDKLWREQDIISKLRRSIEDSAINTTRRRYIGVKGSYDKQSVLNNRPGAVIEAQSVDAIVPFQEHNLSPDILTSINGMNENIEKTLVSSAGVDVSGSNISATAAMITQNNAEMKDKSMARVLAYTLFKPLFTIIYNSIKDENGLPERGDFRVDVNTANDDALLGAQLIQLTSLYAQVAATPIPVLQPQGLIEMAKTMTGCGDEEIAKYFSIHQPTEQELAAQAKMEEEAAIDKARQATLVDAQVRLTLAQIAELEVNSAETIKNGEDKRLRNEEESIREFKKLDFKEAELIYEMENPDRNISVSR